MSTEALRKKLTAVDLWALGVGLVISGEYFGWSYGWDKGGTLGFLIATAVVALMYLCLIFSLTELTTRIPHAGGPYVYTKQAFGPKLALLSGIATCVEFLFAPGAIAFALGSYLHVIIPSLSVDFAAIAMLVLFGCINLLDVKVSARFELIVTLVAIAELLAFSLVTGAHFSWQNFAKDGMPYGWTGVFASLPYAIWFFLAIEGVAMASEEVENPQRQIPSGYLSAIATLVSLALLVMLASGGVGDWHLLATMDYPIPAAVHMALGEGHPAVKLFAGIGLFGLVASLHGIIFGAGRQVFALARAHILPSALSRLSLNGVPRRAVGFATMVGILSVLSGTTARLITLAAFGALTVYALAMLSLFKIRRDEPNIKDAATTFRTPFYPLTPLLALSLSLVSLAALSYFYPQELAVYIVILLGFWLMRQGQALQASATSATKTPKSA